MRGMHEEFGLGLPVNSEAASAARRRLVVGTAVATVAFVFVMILMFLAVRRTPSIMLESIEGESPDSLAEPNAGRTIRVENLDEDLRTGPRGTRELEIKGNIKNTEDKAVGNADLRCYFKSDSDTGTFLDIPLIVAARLDDLDYGPHRPFSDRDFDVRYGDFPDNLEPDIVRFELVNVTFLTQ